VRALIEALPPPAWANRRAQLSMSSAQSSMASASQAMAP